MRILSVRLSVKRVIPDEMEERSVQIFISYERSFSLVFLEEEWLVGAAPSTVTKFLCVKTVSGKVVMHSLA